MMEAVGIKVKGTTPVVVYATKEGKYKYRTTEPITKSTRDGKEIIAIHHSLGFSTIEEAVGSACRFIKKTWNVDVETLSDDEFSFEKQNVAERVVEKIAPKVGAKLSGFLSTLKEPEAEDEDEDDACESIASKEDEDESLL